MSVRRSFPRSIADSLKLVYHYSAGVVPKVNHRQIKFSLPKIAMRVDAIFVFARMRWYTAPRSFFLIRVCFEGHFMCMDVIMWSILRRKKP